jgi:hypothetical protein
MGFIRRLAVRGYSKELKRMIDSFSKLNNEQIPDILVMAVWLRSTLDVEGNLPVIENDDGELNPELAAYPILLKGIQDWMSILLKKDLKFQYACLSIWVHTLRSILRPEISDLANRMWDILMTGNTNWDKVITKLRDEDIQSGVSHEMVLKIERHARAILKCLPPKQLTVTKDIY